MSDASQALAPPSASLAANRSSTIESTIQPSRERLTDLALGHAAGTRVARLVFVEAEQEVAPSGPEGRVEAPLEPDTVGVRERVE